MADRHPKLFPELEPPPGGTTRLLARLDSDARERLERRAWVAGLSGVAAAAIAVVAVLLPRAPSGAIDPAWLEAPGVIALGVGKPMTEPVEVPAQARGGMAALRVATDDPKVVFYLVASNAK